MKIDTLHAMAILCKRSPGAVAMEELFPRYDIFCERTHSRWVHELRQCGQDAGFTITKSHNGERVMLALEWTK